MIYNLIQFLIDRIHRDKDKEKYKVFAKELYEHSVLDDKHFNFLQKNKTIENEKKYNIKKDDFEL